MMEVYEELNNLDDDSFIEVAPVKYNVVMKGNRKPRILIYENVRFNKVLEPSRFERIISETAKGFDLMVDVKTSGKYYLIYQYGFYVQIFINMTEDVRGVRNNWEVKPKFYILKTDEEYMHMAEKQVCILLDILKKHHMARFIRKSYSLQSRWELKSRIKAMEMLWNYLENNKKYREMLNKGWIDDE